MSSVDTNAWTRPDPPGGDPNRVELPYVLVADTNVERAAMCLDAIRPFKAGVLVARDGDEATRILERFGPPILLIIDLSLARRDGFAVIEGLRAQRRGRTEIIAWAAFRELSEFAAQRLSGLNVRVLRGGAPADVVQTAIEHAFERHSSTASRRRRRRDDTERRGIARDDGGARGKGAAPGANARRRRLPAGTRARRSSARRSRGRPTRPFLIRRTTCRASSAGFSRQAKRWCCPISPTQPLNDVPTSTLQDVVRGLVAVPITGPNGRLSGPSASSISSRSR